MIHETATDASVCISEALAEMQVAPLADGLAVICSSRSPDKLTPNEDAAALIPVTDRSGVMVVADGVGGYRAGEQASRSIIDALKTTVLHDSHVANDSGDASTLRPAILNAIESANDAVLGFAMRAATTLAVVEVQKHTVRPYHVGDSMILVVGQRGKIKLQTISHSPVGFAVESGLLDEKEALHHEERHLVSNVLGMSDMRIEIGSTLQLAPRDTIVIASDGLFDNLHLDEIVECIRKGPLDEGVRRLAADALERMNRPRHRQPSKPDDMTIIAYRRQPCAMSRKTRAQSRKPKRAGTPATTLGSDPAA